jgi:hypothetical protein
VAAFEAEVAGEAAAAGVEHVQVDSVASQQFLIGFEVEDGVLVAVWLGDRLTAESWCSPVRGVFGEELGQGGGLFGEAVGVLVAVEQFG